MFEAYLQGEEDNHKRGLTISIIAHLLILLIFFIPFFYHKMPLQQIGGIVVSFGLPDSGNPDENPESQNEQIVEALNPAEEVSKNERERSAAAEKAVKSTDVAPSKVQIEKPNDRSEISDIIIAQNEKKKLEKEIKEKEEADRKRKAAQDIAQKEADKKAQEEKEKAEFDARKKKFGDLLSGGQGKNNSDGNQGNPNGDPNRSALDNITQGAGQIGEGLSNRDLVFEPVITDDSQLTGKVVVQICVDRTGKVSSAKFTQRGSTTTDKHLIDVAINGAKKYRFSPGDLDSQCGIITINFLVQ